MLFSLIMGIVLDKFTTSGYELYGFIVLFIIVFIIAFTILLSFNNNQLLYLLPIAYILIGFGNASYEMYDHTVIYENAKNKLQTSYVTFERFIEGIVTIILPLLSYAIFKESSDAIKITFVIAIFSYIALFRYYKITKR